MTEPKTKTVSQRTRAEVLEAALRQVDSWIAGNTDRDWIRGYIRGVRETLERTAPR